MAKKKKTEKKEESLGKKITEELEEGKKQIEVEATEEVKVEKIKKREVLKDEKTVVESEFEIPVHKKTPTKPLKKKPARRQPSLKMGDYEFTDREVVTLKSLAKIYYRTKGIQFQESSLTQDKLDKLLKDPRFLSKMWSNSLKI